MNDDRPQDTFPDVLRYFLTIERPKISQGQLAGKLKTSQAYISSIARGRQAGSERMRRKIADFYGYKYEDFLNFKVARDEMHADPALYRLFPHLRQHVDALNAIARTGDRQMTLIYLKRLAEVAENPPEETAAPQAENVV